VHAHTHARERKTATLTINIFTSPTAVLPDMGIWNEAAYSTDWICRLRQALDAEPDAAHVRIVASDQGGWPICDDMVKVCHRSVLFAEGADGVGVGGWWLGGAMVVGWVGGRVGECAWR
jgi:hypothetical protein